MRCDLLIADRSNSLSYSVRLANAPKSTTNTAIEIMADLRTVATLVAVGGATEEGEWLDARLKEQCTRPSHLLEQRPIGPTDGQHGLMADQMDP